MPCGTFTVPEAVVTGYVAVEVGCGIAVPFAAVVWARASEAVKSSNRAKNELHTPRLRMPDEWKMNRRRKKRSQA